MPRKRSSILVPVVAPSPWQEVGPEGRSFARLYITERQLEILKWVQAGKSARDIGVILDISPRTVVQMKRVGGRFRITEVWYEPLRKRALAA